MIRALLHRWRTGHRIWSEHLFWSGEDGRVWFCADCELQFWPISKEGPYENYRDNRVKRTPPWEEDK